jgi:hypothetical protein
MELQAFYEGVLVGSLSLVMIAAIVRLAWAYGALGKGESAYADV